MLINIFEILFPIVSYIFALGINVEILFAQAKRLEQKARLRFFAEERPNNMSAHLYNQFSVYNIISRYFKTIATEKLIKPNKFPLSPVPAL